MNRIRDCRCISIPEVPGICDCIVRRIRIRIISMKKITFISEFFMLFLIALIDSCSVEGGIFKAGMGVGIFIVVAVIIIVVLLVRRASKK